ncbi:hypothetical protein H6P81_014476 [Aristolochia fimbriata]|uniref:WRKY19-like zinc finger domain-containing protein n=1 Tax=Aristolochia fimbriata TaxID=158543 RepID=A0AAV7EHV3_ARIFI|nr:hypothetical protein H6P81_014476 [Aristolochia fimbriata]
MDNRFRLGFSGNHSFNEFENSGKIVPAGREYYADTILRLDSPSAISMKFTCNKGIKRKWNAIDGTLGPEDGSSLVLGLGRSSSSSDSKGSSATACTISSSKETDEESSMDLGLHFHLHLGNEKSPSPKKATPASSALKTSCKFDLELSLSTGPLESEVTTITGGSAHCRNSIEMPFALGSAQAVDEGSTSSRWKFGSILPLLSNSETSYVLNPVPEKPDPGPIAPDHSSAAVSVAKSSVTCTSGLTQPNQLQRSSSSKNCQFKGCGKGARGASGLCIAHGGGRRCQKPGCHKGAEGRTVYCKAHGGGRRCQFLGCTKSAEGRTDYCIAHGGGRRCSNEGCSRAARGKSGLCIRHGGGKRCQRENCTKSAEGFSGLCISHGGGRRCQYPSCTKGAQGSTMFCKAHGGGKRCTVPGCTKGAEGSTPFCKGHGGGKRCSYQGGGVCPKSVHGGTKFCVAHGGGKRCAVPECTKSARGRTDFCVRHGGGKRCKHEGCGKSAQGSTDFCKAHGGGKRCSWGQPGSELGGPTPCDRFARGKTGLCAAHSALVQDRRVHGGGTIGAAMHDPNSGSGDDKTEVGSEDMHVDIMEIVNEAENSGGNGFDMPRCMQSLIPMPTGNVVMPQEPVSLPEGRVHGGSLMALLATGVANRVQGVQPTETGGSPYKLAGNWV